MRSTAEMCADRPVLPEIDKSECSANFLRKSSPDERRSATSRAGLQTDVHLTFPPRERPFQAFPSRNVQLALTYTSKKAEKCSTAQQGGQAYLRKQDTHGKACVCLTLLVLAGIPTMHCSTLLVQTNKWFPLCWKTSEPGNVCFGKMAAIRNTRCLMMQTVFFDVYLCRPVSGHRLTPATLARATRA